MMSKPEEWRIQDFPNGGAGAGAGAVTVNLGQKTIIW